MSTKKYIMTFAYDVPFYRDFVIEAETEEAALAIAEKALADGRFAMTAADPNYENQDGERVFCDGEAEGNDLDYLPSLDEVAPVEP